MFLKIEIICLAQLSIFLACGSMSSGVVFPPPPSPRRLVPRSPCPVPCCPSPPSQSVGRVGIPRDRLLFRRTRFVGEFFIGKSFYFIPFPAHYFLVCEELSRFSLCRADFLDLWIHDNFHGCGCHSVSLCPVLIDKGVPFRPARAWRRGAPSWSPWPSAPR